MRLIGYTLLELALVVGVVGVLAATAMPRLIGLHGDAGKTALNGSAAAATVAMALNASACAANNHVAAAGKCVSVNRCAQLAGVLQAGLPAGFAVGGVDPGLRNGSQSVCTLTDSAGNAKEFTATAAGN